MTSAPTTAPAAVGASSPAPPASPQLGYQPGLDGIRAVAVLAVMLFHAGFSWAVGGYLGVDAFFVLSGFLITNLLLAEWLRSQARVGRGSIGLSAFYARRIRRLFPALALMLLGVGIYAAFIAPPTELNTIRGDALATLGYVGNWRQMLAPQGYFAQLRAPSPLQHTWSLAVEEQWYLVWPLVLVGLLMLRLRLRTLLAVVVGAAIASGVLMSVLYHVDHDVSRVYYGTDTRAQELLIGTGLAVAFTIYGFARSRAGRVAVHAAAAVAVLALVWAWSTVDGARTWLYGGGLGVLAMGVALVIASAIQPGRNPLRATLSWKPLRWIGLISYGLYLWHWPIYVWLSPARTGIHDPYQLLALRWVVTFGIAAASYYCVEMPIRRQRWSMPRLRIMVPVATVALVAMVFAVTAAAVTDPFVSLERAAAQSKRPPTAAAGTNRAAAGTTTSQLSAMKLPAQVVGRTPRVYITGDSVAISMGIGLASVAGPDEVWNQGIVGCGLVGGDFTVASGPDATDAACTARHSAAVVNASAWPADVVVLLVDVWDTFDRQGPYGPIRFGTPDFDKWYLAQLQWLVDPLSRHHVPVALLTAPCVDTSEYTLQDRGEPWASFDPTRVPRLNQLLEEFARRNPRAVTLYDLDAYVCPGGVPVKTIAGENVRTDGVHFSLPGAEWASRWLLPRLVTRVGDRPPPTSTLAGS